MAFKFGTSVSAAPVSNIVNGGTIGSFVKAIPQHITVGLFGLPSGKQLYPVAKPVTVPKPKPAPVKKAPVYSRLTYTPSSLGLHS
jgi:hypothetical protein